MQPWNSIGLSYNPIFSIAANETSISYEVPSQVKRLISPLQVVNVFVCVGVLFVGFNMIRKKLQTGAFFEKKLSVFESLVAFKEDSLSLNQACILLNYYHDMSFEQAKCFLTDTFFKASNDLSSASS